MKQIPLEIDTTGLQPVQFIDAHHLLAATTKETLLLNIDTQTILKHLPVYTYEEYGNEIVTQVSKGVVIAADEWNGSIELSYSDGASARLRVGSNITAWQFAPDGKTLAVSNHHFMEATVRIFDSFTLEEISKFEYSGAECFNEEEYSGFYFREFYTVIRALAFSPDGRYLVVGGLLNCKAMLEIRDLHTHRVMALPVKDSSQVSTLAFNHDSTLLAARTGYITVQLWDTRTGEQINTKTGLYGHHLQFTDIFLFASGSGTMRVWAVPDTESE
jgi:WD40 repeat protein